MFPIRQPRLPNAATPARVNPPELGPPRPAASDHRLRPWLALLLCATAVGPAPAADPVPSAAVTRPHIVFGTDRDYPPFEYFDETGRPAGFNVELVRTLGQELGWEVEVRLDEWPRIRRGLEVEQTIDFADMFRAPTRTVALEFSEPFMVVNFEIFLRRGAPPINSLEDLRGRTVVVQEAAIVQEHLLRLDVGAHIVAAASEPEALQWLAAGKYDCAIVGQLAGRYAIRRHNLTNLVSSGVPVLPVEYCFAVRPGRTDLRLALNRGLGALRAAGRYEQLQEKWFGDLLGRKLTSHVILRYAAWILGPLAALAAAATAWSLLLRRTVARRTAELRAEFAAHALAEQRYADLVDSLPYGVYRTNQKGEATTFTFLSKRWAELTGLAPAAVLKDSALAFAQIHPEDLSSLRGYYNAPGRPPAPFHWEGRLLVRGEFRWMRLDSVPSPLPDGMVQWTGLLADVTDKRRTADALRASERKFAAVFRSSPDALLLTARDTGLIVEVNEACVRITGYAREELLGRSTLALGIWAVPAARTRYIAQLEAEGRVVEMAADLRTKGGEIRHCLLAAEQVEIEGRTHILGIVRDITERQHAEERFRQLAAEQRVILDTITTGIGLLKNRKHQWVNRSFAQMFGYSPEEIAGLDTAINYADPADYRRIGEEGYAALAAGRIYSTETRMKRRDGTIIWCEISGKAVDPTNLQAGSIWALLDITERKRTETALRESEVAFRSLFEASPTPIVLMVDRVFLRVNPMMCQLTGYAEKELLGQSARLLYPDDATFDRVGAELYGQLSREDSCTTEARMLRKDGAPIDVLISVSFLDPAAPAKGIAATLIDITERKLAEERYRTIIQTTVDGFWILTPSGHIQSTNNAVCRMLGYTAEELCGKPVHTIVTSETAEEIATHLGGIAHTGRDRFETRLQKKDGGILDADVSINHLPGSEPRYFVFIRDISERKTREEALHRSEERFRLAIEHTGQLVYDFDIATGRGSWAGATQAMLGYSAEYLASHDPDWWFEQVHPDDRAALVASWQAVVHRNQSIRVIYRFRRADGIWIHLMSTSVHLGDATGKLRRVLGAVADVTKQQTDAEAIRRLNTELEQRVRERTAELDRRIAEVEHLNADLRASQENLAQAAARLQEANANLLAANQELESFSYSVSHDLRSPLRNIAGFIELLRKRSTGQLDSEADRYFGIVGTEAVRMAALIDDLLTFSRIGRAELHFAPVQLATLVAEVQTELHSELTNREVQWKIQPLPQVLGDRTLLRQVVANLLANAVKFTRQRLPAIIEIGAQPASPGAELLTFYVRDNGVGFDPKYVAKLFGVFQRLHNPRDFEGTGIGLANVKRIVTRHGGQVWAEGTPDQGATFFFSLRPATCPSVAP